MSHRSSPQVSVITPAHNAEDFLGEAFDALRRQRFGDFEWVVTDDGSTDATAQLLAGYQREASFPIEVVRHTSARGAAAARNAACAVARGRYFKMLDADDWLEPDHLHVQHAAITSGGGASVVSPVEYVVRRAKGGNLVLGGEPLTLGAREDLLAECVASSPLSHCGFLFRREHLVALGGYDERLSTDEDGWLIVSYLLRGFPIVVANGTKYSYRVNLERGGENLASNDEPEMIASRYEVCRRIRAALEADGKLELFAEPLARRLDHVGLRASTVDPNRATTYFAEATALSPGYKRYGNRLYRLLRRLLPPASARRTYDAFQRLKGRYLR